MSSLIALIIGYLIGSIPFGVLSARFFDLGDLRQIGSGNIGATNVLRTGNKLAAILTLLFDTLKGTAAVGLGFWIGGGEAAALAGAAAFVGHCFPVWLNFKGGKGVATFMGVLLALSFPAFAVFCLSWLGVAFVSKYSSAAALAASTLAGLVMLMTGGLFIGAVALLMVALLWWRHSENIARLRDGTESKISFGSKS